MTPASRKAAPRAVPATRVEKQPPVLVRDAGNDLESSSASVDPALKVSPNVIGSMADLARIAIAACDAPQR